MWVFTGKGDPALLSALAGQLEAAHEGVILAQEMVDGGMTRADAHRRMSEIEHDGDLQREQLVDVLSRSLTPPIDREDMFRLSRSIDDILDTLRDFVRESHLYRVPDQYRFVPFLKSLALGIESLSKAVDALDEHPATVTKLALEAKKCGGAVVRMYQYEIASLFDEEMTSERMKTRELVRRLEIAGSNLGEAADALADGAMKRWH